MIRTTPDALLDGLAEVDRLTYRGRWTEALEELKAFDRRYLKRSLWYNDHLKQAAEQLHMPAIALRLDVSFDQVYKLCLNLLG